MEKTYSVSVNETFHFEFTESEIQALDARVLSSSKTHLLSKERSVIAEINKSDFLNRTYTVSISANPYQVRIKNELDQLIKEMGLSVKSSKAVNLIKAPMPGLILEVNVEAGQEVKEGDFLLVLEAMKMENALVAPRDGVVKEVSVSKGQTVDKNQLLVEMD